MSLEPESQFVEPPVEKAVAVRWALIGLAFNLAAAIVALLAPTTEAINIAQRFAVALMFVGSLISGCTLTLRPGWHVPWFLATASAVAATIAIPPMWTTIPLFTHGLAIVTAVVGILMAASGKLRIVLFSGLIAFHYTGIQMAIMSPPPSPWMVFQIWQRSLSWWFDSIYMNNAYQFYAPDPGPANQLWFCLEYRKDAGENGGPKTESEKIAEELGLDLLLPRYHRWVKLPTRPGDIKDPLAVSYYRRLAITEYTHQGASSNYNTFPSEQADILQRRQSRQNVIPLHGQMAFPTPQFRPPNDLVRNLIMPSYAQHLAHKYAELPAGAEPGLKLHSIRMYRVLHEIVPMDRFAGLRKQSPFRDPFKDKVVDFDQDNKTFLDPDFSPYQGPYDPATYHPYFLGEFLPDGRLKDPLDPLLYWVVPIEKRRGAESCDFKSDDYHEHYRDSLRDHAGSDHRDAELQKIQKK